MRLMTGCACVLVFAVGVSAAPQGPPPAAGQGRAGGRQAAGGPDPARIVPGGGIFVSGWMGKIDGAEAANGQVLNNSKLSQDGAALHVETGPATTFWNPANKASGNYTVKATFHEPKYQAFNSHPHPYGIMIGGNDLGTAKQSYMYCGAYGNGTFIARGFSASDDPSKDTVFSINGARPTANDAIHKAAGTGEPVTQDIAVTVKADSVECSINGTVVGKYPKADIVTEGRLKSTDGIYGIRFAHNTDATVTGLTIIK